MGGGPKIMTQSKVSDEIVAVNAKFETLAKYANVSVLCPELTDSFTKLIAAHTIRTVGSIEIIDIQEHYAKMNFPVKGVPVIVHFFVPKSSMGKRVIANVEVVAKTDYSREARQTLLLNVIFTAETGKADYRIKIGTDKVPEKDGFQIPGIEKYVALEKI